MRTQATDVDKLCISCIWHVENNIAHKQRRSAHLRGLRFVFHILKCLRNQFAQQGGGGHGALNPDRHIMQ